MKAEAILQSDLLDIIFENRNKQYGAYQLRKEYNGRLYRALYLVLGIVLLFISFNILSKYFAPKMVSIISTTNFDTGIILTNVPIPETPPPPVKQTPPVATIRNMVPLIVPDNQARDSIPSIDVIDKNAIGNKTIAGPPPVVDNPPPPEKPAAVIETKKQPEDDKKVIENPEIMPEFPGGTAALLRFLGKNLQVPEEALETGQRIKVPVKLVVNKDGSLGDVEFPAQTDQLFKKEILRVLAKMPKWKPGSVMGKTVAVYFTIPIIFETSEN
jgi:periplasmic protein TonB